MTDTTTIPEAGTAISLDPEQLVIAANVRSNVAIDKPFLASIKAHGVLVPVSVWWDDIAGAWQVLDGQRRVLAAREAATSTIPCWIVPKIAAEDQRIVGQLTVNDHRKALDDVEEATALNDLALFGLSADNIRRKTSIPKARVTQALAVGANPTTVRLLAEKPISLEHAAAIAEFIDDPEEFDHLTEMATERPESMPFFVERARQDARSKKAVAEKRAELEATGVRVLREYPGGHALTIDRLVTKDGTAVPEDEARGADDLAAFVKPYYAGDEPHVSWYVLDPKKHGWHDMYASTAVGNASALSKEEKRAIRSRAADWRAASTVRVDYLKSLVQNRLLISRYPAVHALIAAHMAHRLPHRGYTALTEVTEWLTLPDPPEQRNYADLDFYGIGVELDRYPTRALNVALAIALADVEAVLAAGGQYYKPHETVYPPVARYLHLVEDLGHTLTPIEQRAAGIELTDSEPGAQTT